jgi:hypothetical protein
VRATVNSRRKRPVKAILDFAAMNAVADKTRQSVLEPPMSDEVLEPPMSDEGGIRNPGYYGPWLEVTRGPRL